MTELYHLFSIVYDASDGSHEWGLESYRGLFDMDAATQWVIDNHHDEAQLATIENGKLVWAGTFAELYSASQEMRTIAKGWKLPGERFATITVTNYPRTLTEKNLRPLLEAYVAEEHLTLHHLTYGGIYHSLEFWIDAPIKAWHLWNTAALESLTPEQAMEKVRGLVTIARQKADTNL